MEPGHADQNGFDESTKFKITTIFGDGTEAKL